MFRTKKTLYQVVDEVVFEVSMGSRLIADTWNLNVHLTHLVE